MAAQCRSCGLPLPEEALCGRCLDRPPAYDNARAVFAYAFPIDALIQSLKYKPDLALAPMLGRLLASVPSPDVDALVPMPISTQRIRERGFNQAHEIARVAGRMRDLPVLASACRKVRETPPQAALPWPERARNVRAAFVCDADLAGRHVAIVDDVMTTGATVDELARVLKRAGAESVRVWVIARTLIESGRNR